jgi:hypothetical protein
MDFSMPPSYIEQPLAHHRVDDTDELVIVQRERLHGEVMLWDARGLPLMVWKNWRPGTRMGFRRPPVVVPFRKPEVFEP